MCCRNIRVAIFCFLCQISEQFEALGASIKVQCAVVVGGVDMMAQVRDYLDLNTTIFL